MENQSEEVPLGQVKIGVAFNLKHAETTKSAAPDEQAEYDSMDTVLAIESAIRKLGHKTVLLEADESFPQKLQSEKPDLVFNIAEGRGGRARGLRARRTRRRYGFSGRLRRGLRGGGRRGRLWHHELRHDDLRRHGPGGRVERRALVEEQPVAMATATGTGERSRHPGRHGRADARTGGR